MTAGKTDHSGAPQGQSGPNQPPALAPARYIADTEAWAACLRDLQAAPRVAIDLEANSMFAYRERACLIQISTETTDYIIDPTQPVDLSSLGQIVADPAVEKVFHAAEYDLILMRRDYGWRLTNLFDTMWAVRILGYSQMGLAGLLEKFFGVRTSKRFQKSNWCRRPLSAAELAYAQMDTHYLLSLRDKLAAELEAGGHAAEAAEIFAEQANVRLPNNEFDPQGFWFMNGTIDLRPEQQSVLRELYLFRNQEAKRRDIPPFKIMGERTLLDTAAKMPVRPGELAAIYGMSERQMQRYGRKILSLIADARQSPPPQPPKRTLRPPEKTLNLYERLHRWRKARALARGVESDVIISRDALWSLAHSDPQSVDELAELNILGPWRLNTYGEDIIRLLRQ